MSFCSNCRSGSCAGSLSALPSQASCQRQFTHPSAGGHPALTTKSSFLCHLIKMNKHWFFVFCFLAIATPSYRLHRPDSRLKGEAMTQAIRVVVLKMQAACFAKANGHAARHFAQICISRATLLLSLCCEWMTKVSICLFVACHTQKSRSIQVGCREGREKRVLLSFGRSSMKFTSCRDLALCIDSSKHTRSNKPILAALQSIDGAQRRFSKYAAFTRGTVNLGKMAKFRSPIRHANPTTR